MTRLSPARYLELVASDATRFAEVLAATPVDARVPTCPDWQADDLLHHVGQVHHFWALVVSTRASTREEVDALTPLPRADDREALLESVAGARDRLLAALAEAPADDEVWTWMPSEHHVGFVQRRQAHEACIHRLDAELTAAPDGSERTPLDPMLAADGVDEVLHLVAGALPPGADVDPDEDRRLRVVASDSGDTWLVTMTRVAVTEDGRPKASQGIAVAAADPADGTVRPAAILSGTAEDLDCTLWNRPALGDLQRTGDLRLIEEFVATVRTCLGG